MSGVLALIALVVALVQASRMRQLTERLRRVEDELDLRSRSSLTTSAPPAASAHTESVTPVAAAPDRAHMPVAQPPAQQPLPPRPTRPASPHSTDSMLADHTMALAGGAFVLVATIFFVGWAIDRGWINAFTQFLLALAFGAALVALGARRHQRDRTVDSPRALGTIAGVLCGTGFGVVFIAVVAGVRAWQVMSPVTGAALHLVIAATCALVAIRWRTQDLAIFGCSVGLAAPILVGADIRTSVLVLVCVAMLGALAVAMRTGWSWLLVASAALVGLQLVPWVGSPHRYATVAAVVGGWWLLHILAAAVVERSDPIAPPGTVTTALGATSVAVALLLIPQLTQHERAVVLLVFGVAAGAVAAVAWRLLRAPASAIAVASLVPFVVSAGIGALVSDRDHAATYLVVALAGGCVATAALHLRSRRVLPLVSAGVHAALATIITYTTSANVSDLHARSTPLLQPAITLGSLIVASLVIGMLAVRPGDPDGHRWRSAAIVAGAFHGFVLLSFAVLHVSQQLGQLSLTGSQLTLTLTWVAVGIALLTSAAARRLRVVNHVFGRRAAYVLLAIASLKLIAADTAAFSTPQRVLSFLLVGLGLLAAASLERRLRTSPPSLDSDSPPSHQ